MKDLTSAMWIKVKGLLFLLLGLAAAALLILENPSWKVAGLLALVIGSYDIFAGYNSIKPFINASTYIRFGFAIGTILLYVFGQMPISILLLGGVDAIGGLWTIMSLKSEAQV